MHAIWVEGVRCSPPLRSCDGLAQYGLEALCQNTFVPIAQCHGIHGQRAAPRVLLIEEHRGITVLQTVEDLVRGHLQGVLVEVELDGRHRYAVCRRIDAADLHSRQLAYGCRDMVQLCPPAREFGSLIALDVALERHD